MWYTYFLFLLIPLTCCLRITDLHVPSLVDIRSTVELRCEFDVENSRLESVKWYKDDHEFFRFAPSYQPVMKTFAANGVHVLEHRSNQSVVTLYPLQYNTTGRYQCEVSTEAPHFNVVNKSANMTVLGIPRSAPRIDGVDREYNLREYVTANCTSSPSKPPAIISWLINDEQADDFLTENYRIPPSTDEFGLETRIVGLRFQLSQQYFQRHYLNLSCVASVQGLKKTTSVTIVPVEFKNAMYAQGHSVFASADGLGTSSLTLAHIILVIMHMTRSFIY